jgi:hypothetical protein
MDFSLKSYGLSASVARAARQLIAVTGAAVLLGVAHAPAHAQQSPISDSLIVYDGNGNIVESIVATEADELANGSSHDYLSFAVPADPNEFGGQNLTYVTEPGVPISQGISDVFGVIRDLSGSGDYGLFFNSDSSTLLNVAVPQGARVASEPGPIDATMYLAPLLREGGYTAWFTSDTDAAPEPSTWAMMGLGFAVLGYAGFRSRRRAISIA